MSELKPCPFCGEMPKVNTWTMLGITESRCFCDNEKCPVYLSKTIAIDDWNTRPIEDALQKRAERAEATVEKLIEAGGALCDYAILVSFDHPMGDGQMALNDKSAWDALVTEWQKERETC